MRCVVIRICTVTMLGRGNDKESNILLTYVLSICALPTLTVIHTMPLARDPHTSYMHVIVVESIGG